jgi:hypothetical protein
VCARGRCRFLFSRARAAVARRAAGTGCSSRNLSSSKTSGATALLMFVALTRAREARRFPGALRRSDLLEPPGWRSGCWRRRHLRLSEIVGWQILVRGRRWSSGGRWLTSASPGRGGGDGTGADRAKARYRRRASARGRGRQRDPPGPAPQLFGCRPPPAVIGY